MKYKICVLEVDDGFVAGGNELQRLFDHGWILERVDTANDFIAYILRRKI
jgi:hypothetical protein